GRVHRIATRSFDSRPRSRVGCRRLVLQPCSATPDEPAQPRGFEQESTTHDRDPTMISELIDSWTPRLPSVLRIATAFLFVEHGMQKWLGFPAPPHESIQLMSLAGVGGLMEL